MGGIFAVGLSNQAPSRLARTHNFPWCDLQR